MLKHCPGFNKLYPRPPLMEHISAGRANSGAPVGAQIGGTGIAFYIGNAMGMLRKGRQNTAFE